MVVDYRDTLMFREASEAPQAVECLLDQAREQIGDTIRRLTELQPRLVLTCARGSSDHVATYAKYLFETQLGWITAPFAPSVNSIYGMPLRLDRCAVLAISQSGASPDLVETLRRSQQLRAVTTALINCDGSPMARYADQVVPLSAGPELCVAATKSYITSAAAVAWIVLGLRNQTGNCFVLQQLPGLLRKAQRLDWSSLLEALTGASGLLVIGRGPGLGIAREAALKLKETCGIHAEAFSAAEVMHGPIALIDSGLPVLIFRQSDASAAGIDSLSNQLAERGARVFVAGERAAGTHRGVITLRTVPCDPLLQPIVQIQSFYLAVNRLALRRGYNPDAPAMLRKVTETL